MLDAMPGSSPAFLVLWCLGAFLAGSVPFGLVLVKLAGKGDVRTHGSGNIGATNVGRVGGKALGIVTLLLDIAKGWLPVFLTLHWKLEWNAVSLVALCAVLGHVFTPWLKFKGGKGVATALGAALALEPLWVAPSAVLFVVLLLATRYVSLGSVLGSALMPVSLWFFMTRHPLAVLLPEPLSIGFALWTAVFLLVILKHHENIRRLFKGTESPLWGGKKESTDA
jgi:glycerol-3-phosphate acyltransferase PlsY